MKDVDLGFGEFIEAVKELGDKELVIGVIGDEELAQIALRNEYGTSKIPQRSFLRSTLEENEDNIVLHYLNIYRTTNDLEKAAHQTGDYVEKLVKAKIASGDFVPNAPSTIRRKGRNQPLIDTGRMMNSIKSVVRNRK